MKLTLPQCLLFGRIFAKYGRYVRDVASLDGAFEHSTRRGHSNNADSPRKQAVMPTMGHCRLTSARAMGP